MQSVQLLLDINKQNVQTIHLVVLTKLLRAWDRKDGSFSEDPPNATLAVFKAGTAVDVVVVLRNPRQEGTTLSYDVVVLEGPAAVAGGPAVLFIDNPDAYVRHKLFGLRNL